MKMLVTLVAVVRINNIEMSSKRKLLGVLFLTSYIIQAQDISDSLNAFSIDLLATTSNESNSPQNLILSTYTVWALLSVIDEGARERTAKQLEDTLKISNYERKSAFRNDYTNLSNIISATYQDVNLNKFNAIFTTLEQKLNTTFRDISQQYYDVSIEPTDFSDTRRASNKINKYVARATENRINDFIRPSDLYLAEIVVVSAIYFKGAWMNPFNRSLTRRENFYDEKQNKLGEIYMMYQMGFFPYSRLDWIKGHSVELQYGTDDKMSMIIILPYRDQTLANMLQLMTQQPFSRIIDKLNGAKEEFEGEDVKVYLPRFKVESDLALNIVLEKMGIVDIFDANKANLLGMFPHYLHISSLIQRAEIDVNEEGTVATSASGATIANKIPPPEFLVNRPFLYFIVNKPAKSILFAGKVTLPPRNP